jgi:hypothetical protein
MELGLVKMKMKMKKKMRKCLGNDDIKEEKIFLGR